MTSARAVASLWSCKTNGVPRPRLRRSISTAVSFALGFPGAPARLLPRRTYPGFCMMDLREGGRKGRGPFGPRRCASAAKGSHLGRGGLVLDRGFRRGFVGLPVFAGQLLVGVDCAVGGGEQGVGLHRHVGGEFAGPLRLAFEADRGPVFVVAAIGGAGGRGAGLADLGGVEASRPDCGADEGPDDALEVHLGRLVVEGAFEGLGHPLEGARVLGADRVVVGDDEAKSGCDVFRDALVGAELEGHLEGEGLAGLTLGGGLGAVGSHLGEPFLAPGAAGPSPARSPRCGTTKPGPGGLHPKGRSACGGRRRAANLPREEFGFGRRGNSSTMSRCRPNGLGLGPRITEGNELAMGSSCGPLLAREKGSPKWLARLTRDVPPAIRTCFCRPILMALLFCPLSRGRIKRGKCRLAGNWFIVDDNDVGCSARSSCPHADGRRWPPNFFPQRQGGRCALR